LRALFTSPSDGAAIRGKGKKKGGKKGGKKSSQGCVAPKVPATIDFIPSRRGGYANGGEEGKEREGGKTGNYVAKGSVGLMWEFRH